MARKTFISYKYNESCKYRDKVIESLGDDATYYTGETADSPDISNLKVDSIKNHLKDMIFNTTVTMVILSPSLVKSKWVEWEIEYSLSKYSRDGKTSSINGLIGIIPPFDGDYSWFISAHSNPDGHETNSYINEKQEPLESCMEIDTLKTLKSTHVPAAKALISLPDLIYPM